MPAIPVLGHARIHLLHVIIIIERGEKVAINLPIRYDQAGFEKSNLLIVAALVLMFYALAGSFLRRLLAGRATQPIAKHELGRNT